MAASCNVFGMPREVVEWCENAPKIVRLARENVDAVQLGAEVGRLDTLTLAITLFSIIVALGTLVGFWYYRGIVDIRATDEVRERLPLLLDDYLRANPGVFAEALRKNAGILGAAFNVEGDEDYAEEIAQAMTGDGDAGENGDDPGVGPRDR